MYQLDNPIVSKIRKVKTSFRPDPASKVMTSSTVYRHCTMGDTLETPPKLRINVEKSRSIQSTHKQQDRVKQLQKKMEVQRQSINFYLAQLNRREQQYTKKAQDKENDFSQRMSNYQRLLRAEVGKNARLERQVDFLRQYSAKTACETNFDCSQMTNNQLFDFMVEVRKQLQNRHRCGLELQRTRQPNKGSHDGLSYSKTEDSALIPEQTKFQSKQMDSVVPTFEQQL